MSHFFCSNDYIYSIIIARFFINFHIKYVDSIKPEGKR